MTTQARKPTYSRSCTDCGGEFKTQDLRKLFCSTACKTAKGNRDTVRGKPLMVLAQAWRQGRSTKDPVKKRAARVAFSELCRMLDACNAEDAAAGRRPALEQLAARHRRDGIHQHD